MIVFQVIISLVKLNLVAFIVAWLVASREIQEECISLFKIASVGLKIRIITEITLLFIPMMVVQLFKRGE